MKKPVRRIVVGVATVREEDPALAPAIQLALATGAALDVVHAVETPEEGVRGGDGVGPGRIHRRYLVEARRALEEQVERHAPGLGRGHVLCSAVFGSADEILGVVAERMDADLLVVGATRRGTLARTLLGTTAQRVLHQASHPVLIVDPPLRSPVRRVLLTTDLSALSAGVQERGIGLVERLFPGAAPEFRSLFVEEFVGIAAGERERIVAEARLRLSDFLQEGRPRAVRVEGGVRLGNAAREIVAETVDWFPDLLVLGTHGRTGASRVLLGSVAEAALRGALCSVLVIPAAALQEEQAAAAVPEGGALAVGA